MVKTLLSLFLVVAVSPLLLGWAVEPLLEFRGQIFYLLSPYLTYPSMLALTASMSFMIFWALFKMFIH